MSRSLAFSLVFLAACGSDNGINHFPDDNDDVETDVEDTPPDTSEDTPPDTDEPVDESKPVAVCLANPEEVTPPFEQAIFDGSDSYDPAGHSLVTWRWTLISQPNGSAAALENGNTTSKNITPDLAGDYVARLVVTTDDGRTSEPCEATVTAVPGDDLWVEMFWTHSGDDMDLHLLRPGGTPHQLPGDCYFGNTNPNWGSTSSQADDPKLDLDDIPGTGPENINISDPTNGTYTVFVHDYPGSVYNGQNDVTVNIYAGGSLVWTDTRNINQEDYDEYYAEISWNNGHATITDL